MTTSIGLELHPSLVIPDLAHRKKESALLEMVRAAHTLGVLEDPELVRATLLVRERLGGTAIGRGVALPNARTLFVDEQRLIVARSRRGIDWSAPDASPVQLVLLLLSPPECPPEGHHETLLRLAQAVRTARMRTRLLDADAAELFTTRLREALA